MAYPPVFDALADGHPVADSRVVNWDVADVLSCEELAGLAVLFHGDFLTVDYCINFYAQVAEREDAV